MTRPLPPRGTAPVAAAVLVAAVAGCDATPPESDAFGRPVATTPMPTIGGGPGDVPRYAAAGVSVTPRRVVVGRPLPLTLEDVARDAALRDAPAAVGTLEHPAEGVHPRAVLGQAFGEHPMALRARLVIREHDVDRTEAEGRAVVEGFRYRVDVIAHDPDRPDEVLAEARGEGEAVWQQPTGADGPDFRDRRERVVPTLARLAFAAAVADAQRALDDERDRLAELARERMERAMREAADERRSSRPPADDAGAPGDGASGRGDAGR